MSIDSLAAFSGMPSGKKTHRGKRSRGKGKSPSTQTHLDSINASMKAGDHASAKKSALMLANALHKSAKPSPVGSLKSDLSEL